MTFPKLTKTDDWMARSDVIQPFLNLFDRPNYLEIGVARGITFNALSADKKTGVDPKFQFKTDNFASENVIFHEITSDEFFGKVVDQRERYDVIYLDGLHTAEQTLRDLLNAQLFLKPDGVIIIDDVWPNSYAASIRTLEDHQAFRSSLNIESLAWMGDVFKLLYFVDTFMQQFTMRVINDNFGQAIMWREARAEVQERLILDVAAKSYSDLVLEAYFECMPVADVLEQFKAFHSQGG